EGGFLRLGIGLIAAGAIVYLGLQGARSHRDKMARGLAFGALVSFLTVLIQGLIDTVPANSTQFVVLLTVLTADLCDLGRSARRSQRARVLGRHSGADDDKYVLCLRGFAGALGASVVTCLGVLLVWNAHRAQGATRFFYCYAGTGENQTVDHEQR